MSTSTSTIPSPSVSYSTLNTNVNLTDDLTSPPTSYISLLNSHDTPEGSALSLPQRVTLNWSRTFDTFRQWSSRTLKYTRQLFQERTGQVTRTQDIELEQKIELFHETRHHYEHILNEARQMSNYFAGLLKTQRESFSELQRISASSDDLVDELVRNSQCQKALALNGEALSNSLNTFIDKLHTLTSKAMEDTFVSIKAYESARVEYDACRYEYELFLARNNQSIETVSPADEYIQREYHHFKQIYDKSKENLHVKLKLLDENRVQVMKQQLLNFHNAIGAYFSVSRQQLSL